MPIAAVLEFKNATLEQYDEVIQRMGFEPGGRERLGGPLSLGHGRPTTGSA